VPPPKPDRVQTASRSSSTGSWRKARSDRLVVWGELDEHEPLPETVDGVPVMHGRDLATWLTGQDALLDPSIVEELSEDVRGFANRQQAASTPA